jgi:hypothetical protein
MNNFFKIKILKKKKSKIILYKNSNFFTLKIFNLFNNGQKKKFFIKILNFFNFFYKNYNFFLNKNLTNIDDNVFFFNFLNIINLYLYYFKPVFFINKLKKTNSFVYLKSFKRIKFFFSYFLKSLKLSNKKNLKLKIFDFFINNFFNFKFSNFYLFKISLYKKFLK